MSTSQYHSLLQCADGVLPSIDSLIFGAESVSQSIDLIETALRRGTAAPALRRVLRAWKDQQNKEEESEEEEDEEEPEDGPGEDAEPATHEPLPREDAAAEEKGTQAAEEGTIRRQRREHTQSGRARRRKSRKQSKVAGGSWGVLGGF